MFKELREVMGLSLEQVADELMLTSQQVALLEIEDDEKYSKLFIDAFPIKRYFLENMDVDPFLPSYDQTSPGKRLNLWMLKYKIPAGLIADILEVDVNKVLNFIKGDTFTLTRAEGEKLEKELGINRKWLMYGDGRYKGKPLASVIRAEDSVTGKEKTLLERMTDDFNKLPDKKFKSKSEILAERKSLGLKLRDARKSVNLTLKDAAEILQLSVSRVAQLECGTITQRKAEEVLLRYAKYKKVVSREPEDRKRDNEAHELKSDINKVEWDISNIHVSKFKSESGIVWGNRIQKARKEAGFSQQEVGNMIGKSHATVSLMEKGRVDQDTAEYLIKLIYENRT